VAQYIGSIAGLTGWGRDFCLWRLPLSQGLQLQHVALLEKGIATVQSDESMIEELQDTIGGLADGGT
jgi:hypothetical protein